MIDIEYFYLDPLAGGNLDYHGAGEAGTAGNGFFKDPWVSGQTTPPTKEPGAPYAAMNCTLCHDSHASTNIYHLADSITVAGVDMEVGGWTGDTIGTQSGTTYTLPLTSKTGTQSDHDWGAWCSFCHQMEKHGVDEDKACRSGHMHGGGAF
jgi:predicted CXXCH cytochrome family protein